MEDGELHLDDITDTELPKRILEAELAARRHQADLLAMLAEAHHRKIGRNAIHRSQKHWLADHTNDSPAASGRVVERARLIWHEHPSLGDHYRRGLINDSHLQRFTRVWHRRELRPAFARDLPTLLGWAQKPWPVFAGLLAAWETLVDPIDPNDAAAAAHRKRRMTWAAGVGHDVLIEIDTTTACWAQIEPVLQVLVDRLFESDWAAARAEHGDDASVFDLTRTDSQRWHDALIMSIRAGAGQLVPEASATTNVVVDAATLLAEAERRDAQAAGEQPAPRSSEGATERASTYRCETASGLPLSPSDALDYAIAGRVRLFVFDNDTKDFTASSTQRFFTGVKRLGVLLRDRHCTGAGCATPAHRCQADHRERWHDTHRTLPADGDPRCGPCHRHKSRLEMLGLWPPPPDC